MLFLAGSVLIDADHLPLALADEHPTPDDPRPTTHTLLVPAALAALGQRALAAGVCAHFARDVALGPGAPLLWPLSRSHLHVPYAAYAAATTLLAGRVILGRGL